MSLLVAEQTGDVMDSDKRCVVVAFIEPLDDQFDAVRDILAAIIPEVHQEPGCDFYALHEDTRGRLVFIEAWDSREQWVAHSEFDTVARINAQTEGKLKTAIDVVEMYAMPAGGVQGLLPSTRTGQ